MLELRRATLDDLNALVALEVTCFEPARRASRASLRRSLTSAHQEVWVTGRPIHAAMVLWPRRTRVRIYGLAVAPEQQGRGLGQALVAAALRGLPVVLEADADDARLLAWYERLGFVRQRWCADFYAPGRHAWRMVRSASAPANQR